MRKLLTSLLLTLLAAATAATAAVPESVTRAVRRVDEAATLDVACTINGRAASMTLSGNCFYIDLGGACIYFDGKTQWSYAPADKEVTVFEPTAEELAETNPLQILHSLASDYKGANVKGKANTVRLTPLNPRSRVAEVTVTFDPATGWPASMTLITDSGRADFANLRFTPSKTKKPAGAFKFQPPAGTTVNDLR